MASATTRNQTQRRTQSTPDSALSRLRASEPRSTEVTSSPKSQQSSETTDSGLAKNDSRKISVESIGTEKTISITSQSSTATVDKKGRNSKISHNDIDVILARKISSTDLNSGARPKKKISIISAVEEEPTWRDIGEFQELRRTKCRRLYAKLGQSKDLALFYRSGNFYAMEAWCSHMGGPLFEGDIEDYKGTCHVMCPWHAYMFELSTGRSDIGLRQQVFPAKVENGHVFVEYICPLALYPFL